MRFPVPPPLIQKPARPTLFADVKHISLKAAYRIVRVSVALWSAVGFVVGSVLVFGVSWPLFLHAFPSPVSCAILLVGAATFFGCVFGVWVGKMVLIDFQRAKEICQTKKKTT
jgi:hypothetical protein